MLKLKEYFNIQPNIMALSLVSLVVMMGSSMVTPSLTLYAQQDLGASEFLVGAVIAGFAIGRLVFDMPAGFLADKLGMSKTMIFGLGLLLGASALAGFAQSYWVLLFARILEGIASSIYVSAAIAFVLLSSEVSKRGTSIGNYQSILMIGPIIGPVVGAPIAAIFGYNAPYFAFAAMILVALVIVAFLSYRGRFRTNKTGKVVQPGRNANMSVYLNTAAIATFGFAFLRAGTYTTGLPLFAYGSLELSLFDVGILLTMASLANLVSSFFSGRITQVYGMQKTLFVAILSSAALVFAIPLSTSTFHLLGIVTLLGITSGFFGQSIAWAAEQIEEKVKRGSETGVGPGLGADSHLMRGIGLNRMIGDLGLVVGPLFVGFLVTAFTDHSMLWVITFGASSAVLAAISFLILGTKVKCNIHLR